MSLSLIAYQNCQISSDDAKCVVTLLIDRWSSPLSSEWSASLAESENKQYGYMAVQLTTWSLLLINLPSECTFIGGEKHRQETQLRLDNKQVPALASKGIGGSFVQG